MQESQSRLESIREPPRRECASLRRLAALRQVWKQLDARMRVHEKNRHSYACDDAYFASQGQHRRGGVVRGRALMMKELANGRQKSAFASQKSQQSVQTPNLFDRSHVVSLPEKGQKARFPHLELQAHASDACLSWHPGRVARLVHEKLAQASGVKVSHQPRMKHVFRGLQAR